MKIAILCGMRRILFYFLSFVLVGCLSLQPASLIDDYRVTKSRRWVKEKPRTYHFVFENSKPPEEWRWFTQIHFGVYNDPQQRHYAFEVDHKPYTLLYTSYTRTGERINVWAMVLDELLLRWINMSFFEPDHTTKNIRQYVRVSVRDAHEKDALHPSHPHRKTVIASLEELRRTYLATNNYMDQLFRKD